MSCERRRRRDERRILAAMERAKTLPCLLCGAVPAVAVVLCGPPEFQRRIHAPPGKDRLAVYTLCGGCGLRPDAAARAEAVLLADCGGPALN
jgi:hypothetical protein